MKALILHEVLGFQRASTHIEVERNIL